MAHLESRVNRLLDALDDAIAEERLKRAQKQDGREGSSTSMAIATTPVAGNSFSDFVERVLTGQLAKYRSRRCVACRCSFMCMHVCMYCVFVWHD